ncbi:hypothetical protein BGZ73_002616, partial [Actinomortierella ambigua]
MHISLAVVTLVFVGAVALLDAALAQSTANLIPCLQNIKGDPKSYLTTPSSNSYNTDRLGYNVNFNFLPSAIYHPAGTADAAAAIRCAAVNNVAIAPRSGGHSFEGYGQGGKNGALVIDLNQFQKFEMDTKSSVATIGAGTLLGPMYARLWNAGQYLIPAGTCPTVGIGGQALGGGLGMVSRKYGTVADNVVGMTMLDADGHELQVSATSNPDLFWALRGAGGGSFGLVTEFQIQAYKAPEKLTTFSYKFRLDDYRAVIDAYTRWGETAPDEIFGMLSVRGSAKEMDLRFTYTGERSAAQAVVQTMLEQIPTTPTMSDIREHNWLDVATRWSGSNATLDRPDLTAHRYHRGGSLLYRRLLSTAEMDILYKYLSKPPAGSSSVYVIIELWGGQIDRPLSPAAFDNHRGVKLGLDFGIAWKDKTSQTGTQCVPCLEWSRALRKEMYAAY